MLSLGYKKIMVTGYLGQVYFSRDNRIMGPVRHFRQRPSFTFSTEPGIFCAIHTYGRRLNWHPHVHVSVTCGGLNKHGQWKKLSFLKDAMRSRWM